MLWKIAYRNTISFLHIYQRLPPHHTHCLHIPNKNYNCIITSWIDLKTPFKYLCNDVNIFFQHYIRNIKTFEHLKHKVFFAFPQSLCIPFKLYYLSSVLDTPIYLSDNGQMKLPIIFKNWNGTKQSCHLPQNLHR